MKTSTLFFLFLTLLLFVKPAFTEASSIEINSSRHLDDVASPESFVTVQLNYSLTGDILGLIITERIPSGFKFINSSSNPPANAAKYNETASEVKWLFISLQQTSKIALNYTVEIPITVLENTYTFEGYWKAVSTETEASGVSPNTEIQVERVRTTENSINFPIPIHIIAILATVMVVAVIIVVILARRHRFAGGS